MKGKVMSGPEWEYLWSEEEVYYCKICGWEVNEDEYNYQRVPDEEGNLTDHAVACCPRCGYCLEY